MARSEEAGTGGSRTVEFLKRSDGGLIVRMIVSPATNVKPQKTFVQAKNNSRVRAVTGLLPLILAIVWQCGQNIPTGLAIVRPPG